jgi:iron complex outermembrane recepter protein
MFLQSQSRLLGYLTILAIISCFNLELSAGEKDPNGEKNITDMSLEELMNVEITSSARRPQSLGRATRAMYVITAEDIRQAGPVGIEELLRQVPGMSVFRQKGLVYAIGSRGYTKWNNERMQVLLDGRPLYDPYLGGAALFYLNPVFLDEIERIEVIRGSGGVVWGVNAMNGVINIITKKAADTQGGLVYGSIGTQELQQGFIRYGGTEGPLAYRATVGNFHENGFAHEHEWDYGTGTASGAPLGDEYEAFQTTGRADIKLSDDSTILLTGGHQEASSNNETLDYGNLLWKKTFADDSSLQARWTESEIRRTNRNWLATDHITWLGGDTRAHEEMFEIQHNFEHNSHNIVWGADYTRDIYDSTPRKTGGISATSPDSFSNDQGSAFIEDEITLADNLWYTIGFRAHYNEFTNYDWAGSMALVWEFAPKHFLRGAISKSFRRPTIWEEFLTDNVSWGKFGNDFLSNEEMVSYEVGYRGQLAKNLSVNIEGYLNKDKDIIALATLTSPSWHREFENVYDITTYGLSTSVEWRPVDWWLVRGFHTYMHQTNRNQFINGSSGSMKGEKDEIMLSPQHQTGLTNRIYLDKSTTLNTQLYWNNGGATIAVVGQEETKSFWKLDVRLARSIWKDTAEIAIGATNLLAPSHHEGGYDDWRTSGANLTEVPRQFYFQFFYKF